MKKSLLIFVLGILCNTLYAQIAGVVAPNEEQKANAEKEWKVAEIVEVGKEKPRSHFMSYTNRDIARDNNYELSDWYIPMNGTWDFEYYDDYRSAPCDEFYRNDYDYSWWGTINVPGNWERQGHGTPIYTNVAYEFAPVNPTPPQLPDAIPVGLYRTTFNIPLMLRDRDIFLCLDGVKGATTLYINGEKVGYSEDSKTRAEFRINPYVTEGLNTLAIEVMRWGTGSYLECQDFWRISGIERDVFIWSQPRTRIDDFKVQATLDSTYTDGVFNLEIALKNSFIRPTGYMQVWYEIEDEKGELVDYSYREIEMDGASVDTVRFTRTLQGIKKWSAEKPNLYSLVLRVKKDGRFIEYTSTKIGFRTTEVKGKDFLINGERVLLKGVNYHEHDEVTGHYLSEETIRTDMELMKKANINAIRTSHYPESRKFYELADKYGFYIVSEANIESHGMGYDKKKGGTLANNPQWLNAHMERTENMYEQYKNYPSIVIWSLGNEAGNGYNFYKTYEYLKGIDSLRPVQYERAELEWNTDIFCPMYPTVAKFKEWAEMETDRPYIPCEYAHAMGNSTGGLDEMWDVIYNSDNLQGGFIWDWVDQGFLEYNADSTDITWFYGGDYFGKGGEKLPSDGNFLINGLVSADRTPHPALLSQVKKTYQDIHFKALDLDGGKFEITNYYNFTPTSELKINYRVKQGSRTVTSGKLNLNVPADQSKEFTLSTARLRGESERYLEFFVTLPEAKGLLPKGHEIASEQFVIEGTKAKTQYSSKSAISFDEDSELISVSSSYFSLIFDKKSGNLCSYDVNGNQLIADEIGLRPLFWRAATDNDYGANLPKKMEMWREPSAKLMAQNISAQRGENNTVEVKVNYALPENTSLDILYTIYSSGAVNVNCKFNGNPSSSALIPRLGMRVQLVEEYSSLEYLGRGPEENYSDRKSGTDIGVYNSLVGVDAFDYARPQETGHHTDTRWLSLTKHGRAGLGVVADDVIEFNALRNSVEDFDGEGENAQRFPYQLNNYSEQNPGYGEMKRQTHTWDIGNQPFVELSIDYRQMGLGGADSWGRTPDEQHLIKAKDSAEWGFTLVPLKNDNEIEKYSKYKF